MLPTWSLAAVPLLIAMNAFFVAAEYAVVAVRPPQVEAMRRGRLRRSGMALARLRENPASTIGAIQVCITMTNLLLGWIGEPAMSAVLMRLFGAAAEFLPPAVFTAGSFAASFVIVTLLTVVFSELLPKALTLRYVIVAARLTAVPVLWVRAAVRPLVWLMTHMANMVTRPLGLGRVDDLEEDVTSLGELQLMAARAGELGVLTEPSKALVLNSLAIAGKSAREVMVPRVNVDFLDLRWDMDENRRVMNQRLHTWYPLCDGGMDRVVGLVPTKAFLAAYHAAADTSVLSLIAHKPTFVPETVPLDKLLASFKQSHEQLVFLVDEYGGVEGIVTLGDAVAEIVGRPEIPEGTGPDEPVRLSALTPLREVARRLDRPAWAADEPVSTLGGLLMARLGRPPKTGEETTVDGVRLRATRVTLHTVREVEISAPPREQPDADVTD